MIKTFEIYSQQNNEIEINKKSGPLAFIKAKNEIEALKKYWLYLKTVSTTNSYFYNICYCAIDRDNKLYDFLDTYKKSSKKYNKLNIISN